MKTNLKSILNVTGKVGLGLLGAGVAVFAVILAICCYIGRCGRADYGDRTISQDVEVHAYQNGVRIWNRATKKSTTKKLRWVSGEACEGDSLAVFCDKQGRRGYYNTNTGEVVIPAQYTKAWNFSEGLAAVLGEDNCVGFIDKDGRLIIGYEIPFEGGYDYIFRNGLCSVMYYDEDGRGHAALYRKDGSLALDWSHKYIGEADENGYRLVCTAEGKCIVDSTLKNVLPDVYERVEYTPRGVIVTKNHTKQLLGLDGTVIELFLIDDAKPLGYLVELDNGDPAKYCLDNDIMVYFVDEWEGLMDARTGKIITPAIYRNIDMVSKDLIKAHVGIYSDSVLLDRKGRVVEMK